MYPSFAEKDEMQIETHIVLAGGRIRCCRCLAQSKRTKQQCQAPAMKGKSKCRFHGGKSTGPKTLAGRQRIADVKTIHGHECDPTDP